MTIARLIQEKKTNSSLATQIRFTTTYSPWMNNKLNKL